MANFFKRIFQKIEERTLEEKKEILIFQDFLLRVNEVFQKEVFISKKMLSAMTAPFQSQLEELSLFASKDILKEYIKKNNFQLEEITKALAVYQNLETRRKQHNEDFIQKALIQDKEYFDQILAKDNPNIILDEEQRRVVLNDEDYCLVIAAAGAGKTTTIAAKVRYLVEKKNVAPNKILIVSFTQKAVDELQKRIIEKLNIPAKISTFHSIGNSILRDVNKQNFRVAGEGLMYQIVSQYLTQNMITNKELLHKLILFFGYYIDAPPEMLTRQAHLDYNMSADFSTLKSNLGKINDQMINKRNKKQLTIKNELVKSFGEIQIANFLYLNGIEYEYEKEYPFKIPGATKLYTPDFFIKQNGKVWYIEHFGITESGKSNRYSELELIKYRGQIADKCLIHNQHQTELIITYASYNDQRSLLSHLEDELRSRGILFFPRKDEEVYFDLIKEVDNKYFDKMIRLLIRFISNFKTKDYSEEDFNTLRNQTDNVRSKIFLDLAEQVYLEYQRILKQNNLVDFNDMINQSSRSLKEVRDLNHKIDYEYIIVDEYQDISRQRFNLTQMLSEVTDAKIIAVGDDWQSVYAFAGSEVNLFTKFPEEMGYADILHITHTYRNSQELIDIAGNFVQENPMQIRKKLISPKSISTPVLIYGYSDDTKANQVKGLRGVLEEKAKALEGVLKEIYIRHKNDHLNVLIIGRYGFDAHQLDQTGYFRYDAQTGRFTSNAYPNLRLTFLTAHRSKGLTFDEVIIINAVNGIYGFPSQIIDDPVLSLVTYVDRSYEYAEERRLFYVALTRTKNRVHIVAPLQKPSKFVLELLHYPGVYTKDDFNQEYVERKMHLKTCPVCQYPLQLRNNKTYGLILYMCTNEPELCDFLTNDLHGGATTIRMCPSCVDGYLVVKKVSGKNEYFLGCTNYNNDHSCTKTLPLD